MRWKKHDPKVLWNLSQLNNESTLQTIFIVTIGNCFPKSPSSPIKAAQLRMGHIFIISGGIGPLPWQNPLRVVGTRNSIGRTNQVRCSSILAQVEEEDPTFLCPNMLRILIRLFVVVVPTSSSFGIIYKPSGLVGLFRSCSGRDLGCIFSGFARHRRREQTTRSA